VPRPSPAPGRQVPASAVRASSPARGGSGEKPDAVAGPDLLSSCA
jgi:hypothetical protein